MGELDSLVTWMRQRGVTSVRLPNGTEIELGPVPLAPATEPTPVKLSASQIQERKRARVNATLFRGSMVVPK